MQSAKLNIFIVYAHESRRPSRSSQVYQGSVLPLSSSFMTEFFRVLAYEALF